MQFLCDNRTPFGVPVEPEVYIMIAISSPFGGTFSARNKDFINRIEFNKILLLPLTKFALVSDLDNLVEWQNLDALLETRSLGLVQLILHIDNGVHIGTVSQQRLKLWQEIVRGDDSGNFRFADAYKGLK